MKIIDLLKSEDDIIYIQGSWTRLLVSVGLPGSGVVLYEVFSKSLRSSPYYKCKEYEGYDEDEAVAAFIKSEKR